jgi:hypothetical protein
MAGDIIYFSVAGPVGYYTGAHAVIFRVVFSLYYSPEGRAKLRWAGRGGALYFLGCRIAYNGGMDWGILYIKASVVQWKYTPLAAA